MIPPAINASSSNPFVNFSGQLQLIASALELESWPSKSTLFLDAAAGAENEAPQVVTHGNQNEINRVFPTLN